MPCLWQSSKSDSNTWESFTRSGLKLESVHQESPRSDVFRKKATQATSEPETTSEASYLGCGVNFAFHLEIKVPESGGRVERHRIHVCLKSSVKFPQSVMIWLPCHLLVLVHLFSEVHSQRSHLPGNFRALHDSFC